MSCSLTNTGKLRKINEDGLLINTLLISQEDLVEPVCNVRSGKKHLYVVADGLGGHSRGDLASRTVLELFQHEADQVQDEESLLSIIDLAKSRLNSLVRDDPTLYGLGTTIAGLLIHEEKALAFNCGDCRVYRSRAEKPLARLSKDHSLVQELVDRGEISEDQARFHPNRNIVTATVAGDLLQAGPQVYTTAEELKPHDRYLICSDGVWENFTDRQIAGLLSLSSLVEGANEIARRVLKSGARDNFSLILIEIEDSSDPSIE